MDNQVEKYMQFLDDFYISLKLKSIESVLDTSVQTALISVDVTNAFCRSGNLASDRIARIIPPVVQLLNLAWEKGLRDIILLHDCHTANAEEFGAFPQHALCGTDESEAVDEIRSLPFYKSIRIIEKNSIHPAHDTGFTRWLDANPRINTFIVIGDCTDLCVYQTAMHLRTTANAADLQRRVIIPENCVDTYDFPVEAALESNAEPHPADLIHKLFLHHMQLNGIEIVKELF